MANGGGEWGTVVHQCFRRPHTVTRTYQFRFRRTARREELDESGSSSFHILRQHTHISFRTTAAFKHMAARILLAVTGSVAAVKLAPLLRLLARHSVHVRVVVTTHACHFFDRDEVADLGVEILTDESEWSSWTSLSDPVLHIELRKWADLMLIAPLDANTMAKMAAGMCDNLLTCVVRAWDREKPLLFCPAMNTLMWEHPATAQHLSQLNEWGYRQIPPVVKKLACGDYGCGGMADLETIVQTVLTLLPNSSPE